MNTSAFTRHFQASRLTALALAALSACGGGADVATVEPALAPSYHLAPVQPTEPGDIDADGQQASAHAAPLSISVSGRAAALSTARRVPADLQAALADTAASGPTVGALAAARVATVYTPAQIRAAYGFAQLPAASTANQGVYQGSGQTLYIIDAYHNPNIANDLAVFNLKFGLPTCGNLNITATTHLPLPSAVAGSGCNFAVVYAATAGSTPIGALSSKAPIVNKGWVTESSLDVQWAHAIAPMARIVLIEAASSLVSDLMAAVDLANKMGPGVVSMSFGAHEFNYSSMQYWGTPLGGSKMSYVASNGDGASQVNWPAVDARVLAVGGTTLQWNGSSRSETVWSSTGGAISTQVPVPAYQAGIRKPGDPSTAGAKIFRGSTDVAFNADPYSGQYVYVTPSAATGGTGWVCAGGTSIAAPQWAGLVGIGNAVRAASSKAPLGLLQTSLYTAIAKTASVYAANLSDIKIGSNGSCGAMCNASVNYDLPTGLGTPNTAPLVQFLAAY